MHVQAFCQDMCARFCVCVCVRCDSVGGDPWSGSPVTGAHLRFCELSSQCAKQPPEDRISHCDPAPEVTEIHLRGQTWNTHVTCCGDIARWEETDTSGKYIYSSQMYLNTLTVALHLPAAILKWCTNIHNPRIHTNISYSEMDYSVKCGLLFLVVQVHFEANTFAFI